jgi:hypothetical protein
VRVAYGNSSRNGEVGNRPAKEDIHEQHERWWRETQIRVVKRTMASKRRQC